LTLINVVLLRKLAQHPRPPLPLYRSGVRYQKPGKKRWHTVAELYDRGFGDCKDLVAARCAELRFYNHEHATPVVYQTRRAHRYHAVVRREDGRIEDPSRIIRHLAERRTGRRQEAVR
jgi:hypothetical protein